MINKSLYQYLDKTQIEIGDIIKADESNFQGYALVLNSFIDYKGRKRILFSKLKSLTDLPLDQKKEIKNYTSPFGFYLPKQNAPFSESFASYGELHQSDDIIEKSARTRVVASLSEDFCTLLQYHVANHFTTSIRAQHFGNEIEGWVNELELKFFSRKTIVVFSTHWGSRHGGIDSFNLDFCLSLSEVLKDSHQIMCMTLEISEQYKSLAAKNNIELLQLERSSDNQGSIDAVRWREVESELKSRGIDVGWWVGHDDKTGAIANECSKKFKGKSIVFHHMNFKAYAALKDAKKYKQQEEKQKIVFRDADIILPIGPKLKKSAIDISIINSQEKRMIEFIPGFPRVQPTTSALYNFSAFVMGRLSEEDEIIKQPKLACFAFGKALNDHDLKGDFSLSLIGADLSQDSVDALKNDVEQRTGRFYAFKPHRFIEDRSSLFEEIKNQSLCIMPSLHEGFGLVAWEALAVGVPVILSKNSGVYEFLYTHFPLFHEKAFYGVDIKGSPTPNKPNDEDLESLSLTIAYLINDITSAKEHALKLREELAKKYGWERTLDDIKYIFFEQEK